MAAHGIRVHERDAGDEDEHHLLRLVDSEPQDGQRNQRGDRQVASEQRDAARPRLRRPARIRRRSPAARRSGRQGRIRSARASASRRCSAGAHARSRGCGSWRPLRPGSAGSRARSAALPRRRPWSPATRGATTSATMPAPSRRRTIRDGETRSANSGGLASWRHLLGGRASAGYTLISTRRFFAWFSGSAGSAGWSQPIPALAN